MAQLTGDPEQSGFSAHGLLADLALRRMDARGLDDVEVRMGLVERITIGRREIEANVLYAQAASEALAGPDLPLAAALVGTFLASQQALGSVLSRAKAEQRFEYSAYAYARQLARAARIIIALRDGTPLARISLRGL